MNIKEIKINNYGNLENKEINLENGINIVYGKNESGKSTLWFHIYFSLFFHQLTNKLYHFNHINKRITNNFTYIYIFI